MFGKLEGRVFFLHAERTPEGKEGGSDRNVAFVFKCRALLLSSDCGAHPAKFGDCDSLQPRSSQVCQLMFLFPPALQLKINFVEFFSRLFKYSVLKHLITQVIYMERSDNISNGSLLFMPFAKFYLILGEGLKLVTMATPSKLQQSHYGC